MTRAVSGAFDVSGWFNESDATATISLQSKQFKLEKVLTYIDASVKEIMRIVLARTDFSAKYDLSGDEQFLYVLTRQPSPHIFVTELFPQTQQIPRSGSHLGEIIFHQAFEEVIERYTSDQRKPNPVLQETRASNFCYQLTVKFEAIPASKAKYPEMWRLLREFQILQFIWETHRTELRARKCNPDQLIGFPMPFEFNNVVGSQAYDFPRMTMEEFQHYNVNGKAVKVCLQPVSPFGFGTNSKTILSSLSYMSIEKVGPNLSYLMELMQTKERTISLSSALKAYDQMISRLMVLHQFGVAHCDVNPDCFHFGCKEAAHVVYINSFDMAVVCDPDGAPLPFFRDRFASYVQTKERKCHYLYDLESAFYVFLYMLLGKLPWDSRLQQPSSSQEDSVVEAVTNKSATIDLKEKFWNAPEGFHWVINAITFEFHEPLYRNFSTDLLDTLYARMKDSIKNCLPMSPVTFLKQICIPGSAPNSCYTGMRKVIASYFRFESLSTSMKDVLCTSKLGILMKEDAKDKRVAWDLGSWCWNYLDPDHKTRRASHISRTAD